VQPAPPSLTKQFFQTDEYLHLLFGATAQLYSLDELLLALLREFSGTVPFDQERLEQFMHTYALLAGNDYRRLKLFLQRAQPIMQRSTKAHARRTPLAATPATP